MLKICVLLFLILSTAYSYASDKCKKEQENASYWNKSLLQSATEFKRDKHRDAKLAFLLCMREPEIKPKQAKKSINDRPRVSSTSQAIQTNRIRRPSHSSINFSHYTGFKGEKLNAWIRFYTEIDECVENKGDMALFVRCGEDRKSHIATFNERWDPVKKRLLIHIN